MPSGSVDAPPAPPSPAERFLRRRARFRRIGLIVCVVALGSILIGNLWQQTRGGDDWARFDRQFFIVQSVPAGDTIVVVPVDGGPAEDVELLGIDAPDPPAPGKPMPHWATEAHNSLRERAEGRRVMLSLPSLSPRTSNRRLQAYVYLNEGVPAVSLNEMLVGEGQAYADRRTDHSMLKQFTQAEDEARRKKMGLWQNVRDDQQPPWRQEWLRKLWEERPRRRVEPN